MMIVPRATWTPITTTAGGIYRPEAFGVPSGVNAAVDMPLVQAAIAAAETAGGGTVRLDSTYAYLAQATVNVGGYPNVTYGLWVNGNNITLDGHNTGKLVITGMPAFGTSFIGVLIGNGGYTGVYPGWATVKATGTWISHSGIKDITFDHSALTDANIIDLTVSAIGSCIGLCFCDYGFATGITIDRGWGVTGAITSHCSSLHSTIKDVTVALTYRTGVHLDGAEDATVDNVTVLDYLDAVTRVGILIAANSDYRHSSYRNTVENCTISNTFCGIAATGEDHIIKDNTINLYNAAITYPGIQIDVYSNIAGKYLTKNVTVTGNTVIKPGAQQGWGTWLYGEDVNGYDSTPLTVEGCVISGNTFTNLVFGITLGQQVIGNTFTGNDISTCISESVDISGGTAHGNTIGPNP